MGHAMLKTRKILPPLDHLLAFEAAARTGSFARASAVLNISETAISRKVRLLEQHYDVVLFVRGPRSIRLTEQGEALLDKVTQAMELLREASRELLARQRGRTVTLAATNSVAALWLMPRLRLFAPRNPRVKIMLVASDSDEECLSERMDLAILRGDGDWPCFEARLLFGETVFPVCAPSYLARHPEAADIAALPGLDLIEVASRHTEWMDWRTWLARQGIDDPVFERAAYFNTYPLAIQAAQDGLGIALGWAHLVDRLLDSGALVRPLGTREVRTSSGYYLLTDRRRAPFAERRIVEDWLVEMSAQRRRYSEPAAPAEPAADGG
ncbi:MAG: transcriptional regulator GcvA [Roseovarius sp.]